jgi:S-adenosylmethionine:tRNA ribosyltransferase-isomerase
MKDQRLALGERALLLSDYDYDLPEELIAQYPAEQRDASRLMIVNRGTDHLVHRTFRDIVEFLYPEDLLVINDTRVLPARLQGRRPTGGSVELLLLRQFQPGLWEAMGRPGHRLRPGSTVYLQTSDGREVDQVAIVERRLNDGLFMIRLPAEVESRLDTYGMMPLPPYIHQSLDDPERYQTVYAENAGSAAAPTAGLHFTPRLLARLKEQGIRVARVTLHVGIGTFLPVKVEDARSHQMHAEWFRVPFETRAAVRQAKEQGGRVIAVGTTSCRTLESIARSDQDEREVSGWTDLYITPGYQWKVVDALITNFHLPRSTLLLLACAFAGRELMLSAYEEAIRYRYRFFSFGDAMLIT